QAPFRAHRAGRLAKMALPSGLRRCPGPVRAFSAHLLAATARPGWAGLEPRGPAALTGARPPRASAPATSGASSGVRRGRAAAGAWWWWGSPTPSSGSAPGSTASSSGPTSTRSSASRSSPRAPSRPLLLFQSCCLNVNLIC
ncbi:matrix AAA peptidase interacting protein 1, partial [Chelydra serpentina]